jgi:hypothetical protein
MPKSVSMESALKFNTSLTPKGLSFVLVSYWAPRTGTITTCGSKGDHKSRYAVRRLP